MPTDMDELAIVQPGSGGVLKITQQLASSTRPAVAVVSTAIAGTAVKVQAAGTLLDLQSAAGTSLFKVDGSGNVTAAVTLPDGSPFTAADAGFLAQNFDVGLCDTFTAPTTNVVNLIRVNIRQAMSITNVILASTTGGGTLTSGQNFAGLYNSAGTLLGTSADQTTPWASAGVKTMALTGGPFAVTAGFVWVGFVSNTGATTPSFMRTGALNAAAMNAGFAAATARWATNGTATTALATVTPSSNTLAGVGYWAAVS